MSKRCSIITLTTILMVSICMSFMVFADDDYAPDLPNEPYLEPPILERISDGVINFLPGEAREIIVKFKNVGDWMAKDVQVRASLSSVNAPINAELGRNSDKLGDVPKNADRDVRLNVRVSGAAASETYGIELRLTYRDRNNRLIERTETIYIKVEGEDTTPELIVRDFTAEGGVYAGSDFTLAAILHNVGAADAKEIQVLVDGFEPSGIFLSGASNNQYYSSLRAGAIQNMSFSLSTHRDIKSGSYPLTFEIRYRDSDGESKKNEFIYYVNVQSSASSGQRANLEILQMSVPTGTYNVAQEFEVVFDVINMGAEEAKNIKITATTDGTAIVPRSADTRSLTQLKPGETSRFSFRFMPTDDAKTRSYTISFKAEYQSSVKSDDTPEIETFEQFVGVNVYNPDDDEEDDDDKKIRIPKIIIDSYSVYPLIVKAGEEFDISMTFRNTHMTTSIENIKVVLTPIERTNDNASSNPFMPVDGSNTFYIAHIAPGGTASKDFRMYAIPNADPRAYTISVDFEYQDADYNKYDANEIIGVTVKQTTKLDTGNIMVPDEAFVLQPVFVNFNLMNTGKSTLNNLTVEIQGEGLDVSRSFMYFGSLNKSGSSYYDGEITPQMPGMLNGKIIITYEDDSGEVTTIDRSFVMNVMDMSSYELGEEYPMDFYLDGRGMGMDESSSLLDLIKNPFVWVGIVVLGAAAFFGKKFYDKKRRPKFDE